MFHKFIVQSYDKELQQITFFKRCDISFLSSIISHSVPYQTKLGEIIYNSGDVASEISFITSGSVRITINDGVKETTVGYCQNGGYFGDFEYTEKRATRIAAYQAVQHSTLLSISYEAFRNALNENSTSFTSFHNELKDRLKNFKEVSKAAVDVAYALLDDMKKEKVVKKRKSSQYPGARSSTFPEVVSEKISSNNRRRTGKISIMFIKNLAFSSTLKRFTPTDQPVVKFLNRIWIDGDKKLYKTIEDRKKHEETILSKINNNGKDANFLYFLLNLGNYIN